MLEPNQIVGSYRVVRFLGAGGMGMVYEVEHTHVRSRHAMKSLAEQYLINPAIRERFKREAQLMSQLSAHPHVVRATDVVETEKQLALIIDLVDGGDLGQALDARPGPLPWAEAWKILKPVVSAVAFAHASKVVHRDLKPENVLLRRDGTWPGVPVVADFGIAKVLGSESATRTQARMGTAGYGAPEQFKNAKEVGAEADVWALGMLTYRLVKGELPVDPEDNMALIKLYEGMTPAPRLTGVPDAVAHAVAAALTPDPGQRPRDAGVFGKLLAAESTDWVPVPSQPRATGTQPDGRPPRSGGTSPTASGTSPGVAAAAPASKRGLWLGVSAAVLAAGAIGYGLSAKDKPAPALARQSASAPASSTTPAATAPAPSAPASAPAATTPSAPSASPPAPPAPPKVRVFPDGFVRIEPGHFMMGSPASEDDRDDDERQHKVTLTRAFWIGKDEVTQAEWEAELNSNPSGFKGCPSCPVEMVSWEDAVQYANARSKKEGLEVCYSGADFKGLACTGYRLPTEAEWEYAARAGSQDSRYGPVDAVGWYSGNSDGKTHPVGEKLANAWGLHDMLGNVWEWTHDSYGDYGGASRDPVGPSSGAGRVLRGGGWVNDARYLRAADRDYSTPGYRGSYLGFRLSRSVP
jgi:formylglycine-generating enzyme required for sulfatase activity/tRNA A-37 threonylcarbamoyl transferase component Bud32